MTLAWNEIKDRTLAFSREWAKTESEDAGTKPFCPELIIPAPNHIATRFE